MGSWKDKLIEKFAHRASQKQAESQSWHSQPPLVPSHCTQYSGTRDGRERIQLVMGLDFGTAYTKVVIGERRRAYAVPFTSVAHPSNPYLLPGTLTIADDGQVRLGSEGLGRRVSDLKMRILDGDTSDETLSLAVAFLALVMRNARGWFLNAHQDTYKHYILDWNVNVGLPTVHSQSEALVSFYQQLVKSAWHASTRSGPVNLDLACDSFADDENALPRHAIGTFPEFAAQINGYVRSPMRRPDIHLLMDVGAGTVDVAAFNVHQIEGDDVFPILGSSVEPLGAHVLLRHRAKHGNQHDRHHDVENATDAEICAQLGVTAGELHDIDRPIRSAILDQVRDVVRMAKRKYPKSRHWTTGVPFFLCGGGARAELYKKLAERMVRDSAPCPLLERNLPVPDRLVAAGIGAAEYDRLSVAYGLSFDQYEIGHIVPSGQIEDLDTLMGGGCQCTACNGTGGLMANSCTVCGGSGWLSP
jgi:hypothetical protein